MRKFSKRLAVVAAVSAVAMTGGIAWAAWNATGGGSASAKAGQAVDLVATAAVPATSRLYPGGTADIELTVTNPNPYPVELTSITVGPATADLAGCTTTGVSVPSSPVAGPWEVPPATAAAPSTTITLSGAAQMNNTSSNGCQGATFTFPVTLAGASS